MKTYWENPHPGWKLGTVQGEVLTRKFDNGRWIAVWSYRSESGYRFNFGLYTACGCNYAYGKSYLPESEFFEMFNEPFSDEDATYFEAYGWSKDQEVSGEELDEAYNIVLYGGEVVP